MIDAKNVWSGVVGVVSDPEFVDDAKNILAFRVAVDGAGRERDTNDYSGYFDMKYFCNEDSQNAKFVVSQIEAGNIKKGSLLGVVGKIMHERWTKDGQRNSKVTIWAENLTYVGGRRPENDTEGGGTGGGTGGSAPAETAKASVPSSF